MPTAQPSGMLCVIPSRLRVGENFTLKLKLRGEVRKIKCAGNWNNRKPELYSPFNLNQARQIQYMDDCLPKWQGQVQIKCNSGLSGPETIDFTGEDQGVFPGDTRPIKTVTGFSFTNPGFHFISLTEPVSGLTCLSNPVYVSETEPTERIFWGDPHWQTFFSDGIRCPEELYAFARDEAFLDFGAISDHMEAITPRQWDYFQAVTNDYNQPGRFATLIGQEWTNHIQENKAPGHRNIYVRGDSAPLLSCTDPKTNTLEKLWKRLEDLEAVVIPHHTSNKVMGVNWELGWEPELEKAVEICSVWGSSECHQDDGNTMPIRSCDGEVKGRHIVDALRQGYRFGFVGGGDIHDGRPGDELHPESYPKTAGTFSSYPQGFTAIYAPANTRENVFDAIKNRHTYAATKSRIYLDLQIHNLTSKPVLTIAAASEEGIETVTLLRNGKTAAVLHPETPDLILQQEIKLDTLTENEFVYVRVQTGKGKLAWSSPIWRD